MLRLIKNTLSILFKPDDKITKIQSQKLNNDYVNGDLIQGDKFKGMLNDILSHRLEQLGLRWRGDYYWISETKDSIRKAVKCFLLKGGKCVIWWGVTFDFIPMISNGKLVYYKSEKTAKLQLFETPNGYKKSFNGMKMVCGEGIISQWGEDNIKLTANMALKCEFNNIKEWFLRASTIEGALQIAKEQSEINLLERQGKVDYKNTYNLHSPEPEYILAFLYAKNGKKDYALWVFDNMIKSDEFQNNPELKEKVRSILTSI